MIHGKTMTPPIIVAHIRFRREANRFERQRKYSEIKIIGKKESLRVTAKRLKVAIVIVCRSNSVEFISSIFSAANKKMAQHNRAVERSAVGEANQTIIPFSTKR